MSEIEITLRNDARYGLARASVLAHQARLKRLVSDRAWLAYLRLEEAQIARLYHALMAIARRGGGRRSSK